MLRYPGLFSLLLLAPAPLVGQESEVPSAVFGRAIDQESRAAISGVRIAAIDDRGRERGAAISDSIGSYRITLEPGKYLLRAQRIGYQTAETRSFELDVHTHLETLLQLSVQAVSIEPLIIVGSRTMVGRLVPYYERLDREGVSRGRFITRAQIDSLSMPGITAHMEYFGVPMQSNRRGEKWPTGTGRCRMRVFIDDVPAEGFVIDELVRPDNIEGVEIYRSAYEAPPRYSSRLNTCGVVLIWTRMDKTPGLTWWKGLLAAGTGIGAALLIRSVWLK
jgi:hypothetical protein